jgi:tripartite-type tricarboxylate transporter receptor subunit TctC
MRKVIKFTLSLLSFMLTAAVSAQDYPTRPITLIVGYSAGGGNDIMARVAAEKMSPVLGQQIVIETRGAGRADRDERAGAGHPSVDSRP